MPRSSALPIETDDSVLDQSGLDGLIGFHLRMAQVKVWREFGEIFASLDLTQNLMAVLTLVRDNPGASQVDMAQVIAADRATMMTLIDRLQQRGLLERRPSLQDKRRQEIHLTPEGLVVMKKAEALVEKHEARVLKAFSSGEQALLREFLRRLHGR